MKNSITKTIIALAFTVISCRDDDRVKSSASAGQDQFVLVSNITSSNPVLGYIGTLSDISVSEFNNGKSRQSTQYPFIKIIGNSIFVLPNKSGDVVKKYNRESGGSLSDGGSLTLPANSLGLCIVQESADRAYCSLMNAGKILIFNPQTMQQTGVIDLTSFAEGDSSPDPNEMLLRNGKLYVACAQTTDGYTSDRPAQILIIDTKTQAVKSITDSRTTMAGNVDEKNSIFQDEKGDIYVSCVASYGFGGDAQKSGILRIKNGEEDFDKSYFFNVKDYNISGIPGGKIDYLEHMEYAGGGILYSTGNIYALASNPPDYVKDRTFGSFRIDLNAQTISRIPLPYSNGYSASVHIAGNKVLWGLSTNTGTGIYIYDKITQQTQEKPNIKTQGDISYIDSF